MSARSHLFWLGLLTAAALGAPVPGRPPAAAPPPAPPSEFIVLLQDACHASHDKACQEILERLNAAESTGEIISLSDPEGRTSLHWSVMGTLPSRPARVIDLYLELISRLIADGADINARDRYGLTPLDWSRVNPRDEVEQLLLENGAVHSMYEDKGRIWGDHLAQTRAWLDQGQCEEVRRRLDALILPGLEIPIRLLSPVSSQHDRIGTAVQAVIPRPVVQAGQTVLAAGARLNGCVLLARKAASQYEHADLLLNFSELVLPGGGTELINTRVIAVDNGRETIAEGVIIGAAYPRSALDKLGWARRAVGLAVPALAAAMEIASFGYGSTLKREIEYSPGVELTLRLQAPTPLRPVPPQPEWLAAAAEADLLTFAAGLPRRNNTTSGIPADLINLLLVGSPNALETAFNEAGWQQAVSLGLQSSLKTFIAAAYQKGYAEAPMSTLLLGVEPPVLKFQKQNNTFAKRHHLRIYPSPTRWPGGEAWLGAATHDTGIGVNRTLNHWYHRIDPEVDREREKVLADLIFAGRVRRFSFVDWPGALPPLVNATGDKLISDGRLLVIWLK